MFATVAVRSAVALFSFQRSSQIPEPSKYRTMHFFSVSYHKEVNGKWCCDAMIKLSGREQGGKGRGGEGGNNSGGEFMP
jgi:hypothetical protein